MQKIAALRQIADGLVLELERYQDYGLVGEHSFVLADDLDSLFESLHGLSDQLRRYNDQSIRAKRELFRSEAKRIELVLEQLTQPNYFDRYFVAEISSDFLREIRPSSLLDLYYDLDQGLIITALPGRQGFFVVARKRGKEDIHEAESEASGFDADDV